MAETDLIIRAEAKLAVREHFLDGGFAGHQDEHEMLKRIDKIEAVEETTAKWRYRTMTVPGGKGQTYSKWSCSNCHKKEKKRSPYCPNCGARMEEY